MSIDTNSPSSPKKKKKGRGPQGTPRRISALQRVAGEVPEGRDVSDSLDEFIALANQTLVDMDGWSLTGEQEAAAARAREEAAQSAARAAAEKARAVAEAQAQQVMEQMQRASRAQMAELQAKLRESEGRLRQAEQRARALSETPVPERLEPSPADALHGSGTLPIRGVVATPMAAMSMVTEPVRRMPAPAARGWVWPVGLAAAGGVALVTLVWLGNGRLWNRPQPAPASAAVQTSVAPPPPAGAPPAGTSSAAAPVPTATPLPVEASHISSGDEHQGANAPQAAALRAGAEGAQRPAAPHATGVSPAAPAVVSTTAASAPAAPPAVSTTAASAPASAPPPVGVPVVTSLQPTVTPLSADPRPAAPAAPSK